MSRDAKRIPEILAVLQELWEESPDLRLGQIISNASITFYTEDDKALTGLAQWRDYHRERKAPPLSARDLLGIAPDYTGGLSVDEYMDEQRGRGNE